MIRSSLGVTEINGVVTGYKYEITVCHWCASVWVGFAAIFIPWQIHLPFAVSALIVIIWVVIEKLQKE